MFDGASSHSRLPFHSPTEYTTVMRPAPVVLGLVFLAVASAAAQRSDSVAARYAKSELRIPMRDGTQLFTAVYQPRDTSRRYPIMITRTPYSVGPYGPTAYPRSLGPSPAFMNEGFIFV